MELTINEKKENVLLERTEISGNIKFTTATPSNADLTEALAKELNTNASLIVVRRILTQFGQHNASFLAVAYKNTSAKEKTEMITKHLRKKIEEDKKKAKEAAQAAAEEKEKNAERLAEEQPEQKEETATPTKEEQQEGEQ